MSDAASLILAVHGDSGAGKSRLSHTAPAPRVIFDAENGSRFIRGKKVYWNPLTEPPPEPGAWETCIVHTRDWPTMKRGFEWINSGKHPFRSLIVDTLTEVQKRARDAIFASGRGQGNGEADEMNERRWGLLLTDLETLVRDLRDLTMHPTNPLQCVVITTHTDLKKGKYRPLVQGALGMSLPGFVDVVGYLDVVEDASDPRGVRRLLIAPVGAFVAKDRTDALTEKHGIYIHKPDVSAMLVDVADYLEGN